jgi:hypothetical protein
MLIPLLVMPQTVAAASSRLLLSAGANMAIQLQLALDIQSSKGNQVGLQDQSSCTE